MQRREDNVAARLNGNALQPLSDVSITVTDDKTGLPASLYSDNGVTPLAQPLMTDNNGYYGYYAANGEYTETFTSPRIASFTRKTVLADPDDNPHATKAELAAGSGSSLVTFTQAGTGAVPLSLQGVLREAVSATQYGAKGDGATDDTTAIMAAINANPVVWLPPGKTYRANTLPIPSNRRLIVDGILKRIDNAPSDSAMIVNASGAAGDSNIVITGAGELDGNAANQSGDRQGLIRFQKPTDCSVSVRRAGNNKYGSGQPVVAGVGCIVFIDATRCKAHDIRLNLWQREGIYFDGASVECTIQRIQALGDGANGWSAVSISGAGAIGNKILDITANNCGATSVVLDSTYSQADNIVSRNNQFNNGINFGHTGKPASWSRASNLTVINAGQAATSGTSHCGVQVGGGTTDFDLSNVTVSGAYNHCIQISDSATRVQLGGKNRLTGAQHGSGVNAFGADQVRIAGTTATGNSDYGVNLNAANDSSVIDSDLRGNTIGGFSGTGSRVMVRNTPLSTDAVVGSINVAGFAAGASTTISNANVAAFSSAVNIFPRNATAAAGLPFVSNKTATGFTLTVVNAVASAGGPHNVSYEIL
jgi:hypothetical protein